MTTHRLGRQTLELYDFYKPPTDLRFCKTFVPSLPFPDPMRTKIITYRVLVPFSCASSTPCQSTRPVISAIMRCGFCVGAATIPILLMTTSGADPGKEMEELAEKTVGRGRYDARFPIQTTNTDCKAFSHRNCHGVVEGASSCMQRPRAFYHVVVLCLRCPLC